METNANVYADERRNLYRRTPKSIEMNTLIHSDERKSTERLPKRQHQDDNILPQNNKT